MERLPVWKNPDTEGHGDIQKPTVGIKKRNTMNVRRLKPVSSMLNLRFKRWNISMFTDSVTESVGITERMKWRIQVCLPSVYYLQVLCRELNIAMNQNRKKKQSFSKFSVNTNTSIIDNVGGILLKRRGTLETRRVILKLF